MKFIGISQRLIENESYFELREALSVEWGELFAQNALFKGLCPLPLSVKLPFKAYAPFLSGVILSGGNDLSAFNENKLSKMRDEYELKIIKNCLKMKLPLLGVCRGAQLIASFFKSDIKGCENHTKEHFVLDLSSRKESEIWVNSFHNYAIFSLKKPLKPLFKSAQDESIEAFRHEKAPIFALMWHIERSAGLSEKSLLKAWLKAVRAYHLQDKPQNKSKEKQ